MSTGGIHQSKSTRHAWFPVVLAPWSTLQHDCSAKICYPIPFTTAKVVFVGWFKLYEAAVTSVCFPQMQIARGQVPVGKGRRVRGRTKMFCRAVGESGSARLLPERPQQEAYEGGEA